MLINFLKNNYFKIFIIILISLIIDNAYIMQNNNPPGWDQGYHLTNIFRMYNILEDGNINNLNKIDQLLNITNSYRGPLSYFLSALFLKIFENNYHYAYLSNQIFNLICIISIFNIGKLIKNESVGIWGSIIFTFSSLILNLRSDYLIDLSLTAFCTLNLLFFAKWYLDYKNNILFPILTGISLGLVFLTKPTGIILFFLPFLLIFFKLLKSKGDKFIKFKVLILFIFSFIIIIYPWFSRHWITIITSIINAWNWGVNYQDGFEFNSLQSWFYYIKKIPLIFGKINSSIFLTIFIFEIFFRKYPLNFKSIKLTNINLIFLIYLINCYLILSFMSTKDIRFALPIYPLLCVYLSNFINSKTYTIFKPKNKKLILIISLSISILLTKNGMISNNLRNKNFNKWPHNEIMKTIRNQNPNLITTLAVLPDTKEINTFNLEAEASRQGEYVAVRQVVSNVNSYKNDLRYFDWFLLKTKDQGVMSSKSKNMLNKYLLESTSFLIHKEWNLPDKSKIILLRRKSLNTSLLKNECPNNSKDIKISQINNGINIKIYGKGSALKSSIVLIDFKNKEFKDSLNISLANGQFHKILDLESCYELSQNISYELPKNNSKDLQVQARILDKDGDINSLNVERNFLKTENKFIEGNFIQMENRVKKVELLGNFLRNGEFKNLFNLVGILNQSDPNQIYLGDSEKIFLQRYSETKNLEDLYSLLISQILQKKVIEAEKTINLILKVDNLNGNSHLAKAIISIYLLDKKNLLNSINNFKSSDKSKESIEIMKTIQGLNYFLEMKFINAYKALI